MPVFPHHYLHNVAFRILLAEDVPEREAEIVATHLVKSNLVGHDSHGIIRVPFYVELIHKGNIVPGSPFEVVKETPTTACIDGHWGFGFVVTEQAMRLAIEKARAHNVAAVTIIHQGHIGRLGAFPAMAAQEGMIGLITSAGGRGPFKKVLPFGGRATRFNTNPLSIAAPSDTEATIVLDMTTSAVAGGKITLAISRKEQVPNTWLLDEDGNPTTDPNDYSLEGTMLPLGGDQGHKGSALSFMVDMFSSILTGMGFGVDPQARLQNCCFISVYKVDAFRPLHQFKQDMLGFTEYIKSTPPAKGFTEVMFPGERGSRAEQQRLKEGIYVEEATWEELWELVTRHKLEEVIGTP